MKLELKTAALTVLLSLSQATFLSPARAEGDAPKPTTPAARPSATGTKILFLGDSVTAGYGLQSEQAYPVLLGQQFLERGHKEIEIANGSISGSTSASAVSRLKWQLKYTPQILVLALGANDGLRGLSPQDMEKNLSEAIRLAQAQGVKVLLIGMKAPPNYGKKYTTEFASVFPRLARRYKTVFMPFLLKDVAGYPKLNQGDGIHPTVEGQRVLARNILVYLEPML